MGVLYPKDIPDKYIEEIKDDDNQAAFNGKTIVLTLPPIVSGYCVYSIFAKNDIGASKATIVEVWN